MHGHFIPRIAVLLLLSVVSAMGQSNTGELRLRIIDPSGLGVRASAEIVSQANQFRETYASDEAGNIRAKRLPFGIYKIEILGNGFAPFSGPSSFVPWFPPSIPPS